MATFEIDGRSIGRGKPPFVIAELSANHNNDLERAKRICDAAASAGASALKLQTYTADSITLDSDREDFHIKNGPWAGRTLYDLYTEAATPWDWHETLFNHCRKLGLTVFSSPFDPKSVDFLDELGVPAFKIASFELVDIPLIRHVASKGKPIIMSTGMAKPAEIEDAVSIARKAGCESLGLLYCISGYPAPVSDANISTIADLKARFDVEVGLSDHTPGIGVAPAAIALGATMLEKHLTLSRADGGADAEFSLEPSEFSALVESVNQAAEALGTVKYGNKASEAGNLRFRRSLYAVEDIKKGDGLTSANIRSIRPAFGLAPKYYDEVLTSTAARDIQRGEPLAWDMLNQPC